MNTTFHTTTRRLILGSAVAAALIGPGAGIAFAESPAQQFEPGLGVVQEEVDPIGPVAPSDADDQVDPQDDDADTPPGNDTTTDDNSDDSTGDENPTDDDNGGAGGGDECVENSEDPNCEPIATPCDENAGDPECPKPPVTLTVVPETPAPTPHVTSDRPTFDTGDERSVGGAGVAGGLIGLIIGSGAAVAVFRRPIR